MNRPVWKIKAFDQLNVRELYKILKLRNQVFIVEQTCPYQDIDDADQTALHLWAEVDGEVAAYCRLFKPGLQFPQANIGRVITGAQFRGTGLGKVLMQLAIETVKNRYANPDIQIAAQNYVLKFYQTLGFRPVGESFLEDDIPHTHMILKA